jgi:hypothetical protein
MSEICLTAASLWVLSISSTITSKLKCAHVHLLILTQSTTNPIRTLKDLLGNGITIGALDIIYSHYALRYEHIHLLTLLQSITTLAALLMAASDRLPSKTPEITSTSSYLCIYLILIS